MTYPITIGLPGDAGGVSIDAPSPLANPYTAVNDSQAAREDVVKWYALWLDHMVAKGNLAVFGELMLLSMRAEQGPLHLVCDEPALHAHAVRVWIETH